MRDVAAVIQQALVEQKRLDVSRLVLAGQRLALSGTEALRLTGSREYFRALTERCAVRRIEQFAADIPPVSLRRNP